MIKEYQTVKEIKGPLLFVEGVSGVSYGELVRIRDETDLVGQVIEVGEGLAVVQVLGNTLGLSRRSRIRFSGEVLRLGVGSEMLGRVFNGMGVPIDGGLMPRFEEKIDVRGNALNPVSRDVPSNFVQTGISTLDVMCSLVRGQKLPIFSGSGLLHHKLAAQIARQAKVSDENFGIVFGAMGITNEESRFLINSLEGSGALERSVLFLNMSEDPTIERLITPKMALTTAEYLAYEQGMNVLVILSDMTNYCDALREVSASRGELPSKMGYPGYMYTDLASIYERAGRIKGKAGSITQLPILTMPDDDVTHPVPDLTGYITEGQVVLSRELHKKNIYPSIQPLSSLSRLMPRGIGEDKTRLNHQSISDQLYALYARAVELRNIVAIVGESVLGESDKKILEFAGNFESKFMNQGFYENRDISHSLNLALELFSIVPESELTKFEMSASKEENHGKETNEG
ncbi:MAG: V-type ATP synthase subunit B [Candidatus Altiarchaeota archaeon]|nr:V-type ATP synthase subunit B [Candidatus Altiarchaeota archaeon]